MRGYLRFCPEATRSGSAIRSLLATLNQGSDSPNAAEPQPKRTSAHTPNAPRFADIDTISFAVHPAIEALLSGPLVYVSGCYGCRTSAGPEWQSLRKSGLISVLVPGLSSGRGSQVRPERWAPATSVSLPRGCREIHKMRGTRQGSYGGRLYAFSGLSPKKWPLAGQLN